MTKKQLFYSIQKIHDSWLDLSTGTREYAVGVHSSIPVIPSRIADILEQDYEQAMEILDDILLSIAPTDSVDELNYSNIVSTNENKNGIRFEQTTLNLRKAICTEVCQRMEEYNITWDDDDDADTCGLWSAEDILECSDPSSITRACTKQTLELILSGTGASFNIITKIDSDNEAVFTLDMRTTKE